MLREKSSNTFVSAASPFAGHLVRIISHLKSREWEILKCCFKGKKGYKQKRGDLIHSYRMYLLARSCLPYLNTVLKGFQYNDKEKILVIKRRGGLITIREKEIAITKVKDEKEAYEIF